jgi:hypothetical protein
MTPPQQNVPTSRSDAPKSEGKQVLDQFQVALLIARMAVQKYLAQKGPSHD